MTNRFRTVPMRDGIRYDSRGAPIPNERRTLIRRSADRLTAGVMRGEVSPYAGEVVELPERPAPRVAYGLCRCGKQIARHTAPGWSPDWWHVSPQDGVVAHTAGPA